MESVPKSTIFFSLCIAILNEERCYGNVNNGVCPEKLCITFVFISLCIALLNEELY